MPFKENITDRFTVEESRTKLLSETNNLLTNGNLRLTTHAYFGPLVPPAHHPPLTTLKKGIKRREVRVALMCDIRVRIVRYPPGLNIKLTIRPIQKSCRYAGVCGYGAHTDDRSPVTLSSELGDLLLV